MHDDIKKLKHENDQLRKENAELRKQIDELKIDLSETKQNLTKLDEELKIIKDNQIKHKNMMITAQLAMLYGEIIVEKVLGRKLKYPNEVTINNIIYDDLKKLNDDQVKIRDEYFNKIGLSGKKFLYYLKNFKDDRNIECHDSIKDSELTIDQIKSIICYHIDNKKQGRIRIELKKFAKIMLKEVKEERGNNPFNDLEEEFDD